jgi:DNA-directed RNA polymerase specialized sigma subunit
VRKKNRAQEYLEQVDKLNAMIENKTAESAQWRSIALGVTANSEGERVQSSSSQQKMADAINRVVDLQAEINCLIDRLIDTKLEIIKTIEQLNATEYDVLHKRYIQGMTFDEVGAAKGKSKSWATTVHGRALQNLNVILDEREKAEAEERRKRDEKRLENIKKYFQIS